MKHPLRLLLAILFCFSAFLGCSGKSDSENFLKVINEEIYVADSFPEFRKLEGADELSSFLGDLEESGGSLVLGGLGILKKDSEKMIWLYGELQAYEIETFMNSDFNADDWN